uniref:LINE-1 type transposase domain-containing 1 n=1 Tax=Cyprinus carpio TaxID=7962 RepID=A0A8C2BPI6_CYPCA
KLIKTKMTLKAEVEKLAIAAKQTRDRVDSVQAAAHEDRRIVANLRKQVEQLTDKVTNMEDRSRRNNVQLVGLPKGVEGSNPAGFLRANLSKWIPALKGRDIEIERAHRVYDGRKSNSKRPRTFIFRVLRWQDRSAILKGARQAYLEKYMQDNVTLLFFPDFSPATSARRRSLKPVLWRVTALDLQPFLIYPAIIQLRHNGEQMIFDSSQKAEDFISSLPQKHLNCPGEENNNVDMDT